MSSTILITGASRGIGLSFVKYFTAQGEKVIACVREPTQELKQTNAEIIAGIDLREESAIEHLRSSVGKQTINLLINCAGAFSKEPPTHVAFDSMQTQWEINTLGPLRVTFALLDTLVSGSKIAMISSRMGSIGDNSSGGYYGYRMSKAALNAASKSLAVDLKPKGIAVAILHPGLVSTRMVDFKGDVTPDEAVAGLIKRINELTLDNSGTFWHANGQILPW